MATATTAQATPTPDFPWETPAIPNTFLFAGVNTHVSRTLLKIFKLEKLSALKLTTSTPLSSKLSIFSTALETKLATLDPKTSYNEWNKSIFALSAIAFDLGDKHRNEELLNEMATAAVAVGKSNLGALSGLAWLYLDTQRYEAADKAVREALPLIQGDERLGKNSPQAFGMWRVLIPAVWKLGRVEEARGLVEEAEEMIETMKDGKFAKYQQEELKELERVLAVLEAGGDDLMTPQN